MKKIKILATALLLASAMGAQAQTSPAEAAPALNEAPPALSKPASKPVSQEEKSLPAASPVMQKPRFSLSMGSQFSRFGQAAFLQPTMALPLTQRFQAFASVRFINFSGPAFYGMRPEAGGFNSRSQQSYMFMAGGNYALTQNLNITGSIWRDISSAQGLSPLSGNLFSPAASQGMNLRAHYKINDRLSVSGGFRYGNSRGYNGYNSYFYPDYNAPFGF